MTPFKPTHRISYGQRRILVQCVDGACYTRAEWQACDRADWETSPLGTLTFMGVKVRATIKALESDA